MSLGLLNHYTKRGLVLGALNESRSVVATSAGLTNQDRDSLGYSPSNAIIHNTQSVYRHHMYDELLTIENLFPYQI
jgi:hypothetical protein